MLVRSLIAAGVAVGALFVGGPGPLVPGPGPWVPPQPPVGSVQPVAPGVRVDLSNEGEDVLGCLLRLGYKPVPGSLGRLPGGLGSLEVTPADRALCGRFV